MPVGLINALNEEELKDSIAYLMASGDPKTMFTSDLALASERVNDLPCGYPIVGTRYWMKPAGVQRESPRFSEIEECHKPGLVSLSISKISRRIAISKWP